jgi:hypothetical protein
MPDYGRAHKQLRAALLARYVPGVTLCWRCEKPIKTLRTRHIHLGHDDNNPLLWRGLEHAHCNFEAGGIKRTRMDKPLPRRVRRTTPPAVQPSRDW